MRLWGNAKPHNGRTSSEYGQLRIWRERHRILSGAIKTVFLPCGPGWGKDRLSIWLALDVALKLAAKRAGSGLIPRVNVWVLAPTEALLNQVWAEYKEYTRPLRPGDAGELNSSGKRRLNLPGGIVLSFKQTTNYKSLASEGVDIMHVTEASEVSDEAWRRARQRLNRPGRLGLLIANGTPDRNPSRWYLQLWDRLEAGDPTMLAVNAPSWENPHLNHDQLIELERIRENELPELDFRATYGAERIPYMDGVFRNVPGVCTGVFDRAASKGRNVVAFCDLADSRDFCFLSVIAIDKPCTGHDRVTASKAPFPDEVYCDRWNRVGWEVSRERIVNGLDGMRGTLMVDVTGMNIGGDPLVRELDRILRPKGWRVSGLKFDNAKKERMVRNFAVLSEGNKIRLLEPRQPDSCPRHVADAAKVRYRELLEFIAKPGATVTRYEGSGEHDDGAVATIAAALMATENMGRGKSPARILAEMPAP